MIYVDEKWKIRQVGSRSNLNTRTKELMAWSGVYNYTPQD